MNSVRVTSPYSSSSVSRLERVVAELSTLLSISENRIDSLFEFRTTNVWSIVDFESKLSRLSTSLRRFLRIDFTPLLSASPMLLWIMPLIIKSRVPQLLVKSTVPTYHFH